PLTLGLCYGLGRAAVAAWRAMPSDAATGGLCCLAIAGLALLLVWAVGLRYLARRRLLRLRLCPGAARAVLRGPLWLMGRREEAVTDVAAVVLVCDRHGQARQVWLERRGGWQRHVEGGRAGEGVEVLAEDLSGSLGVPLRREIGRWLWPDRRR